MEENERTPLTSNDLALKRTVMAAERTLMAWIRTAISMIGFGFTIYKFFDYLVQSQGRRPGGLVGPQQLALILIAVGTLSLVAAIVQHGQFMASLDNAQISKRTLTVIVALLTVLIGVSAFVNVVTS